jgi:hypothetical protein
VTVRGNSGVERLVESFESPLHPADRTSSFVQLVSGYQESDGSQQAYRPTDPEGSGSMARLEARGSTASAMESFLGLSAGTLPRDIDGSSPAFGSALKVRATVQAGDKLSFDWLFDAKDFVNDPPDGRADNDFAVVSIDDGQNSRLFRLSDVREVGDQGASGWRAAVFTADKPGDLVIGIGVVNDRTPVPISENSFLLVDNVRINRDFDDGYQVVSTQGGGAFETLSPMAGV